MPSTFQPVPSRRSVTLSDSLDAIDRAEAGAARARAAADELEALGFDRVVITLRDASLNVTATVSIGNVEHPQSQRHALQPLPGAVWRRRLPQLERFRVGDLFFLDGADSWVAREFFGLEAESKADGEMWLQTDLLLGLLRGNAGETIGIVKLTSPRSGMRPDAELLRDISVLLRHLAARLAYDALQRLALQRAERLQRLQEAGAALARSLDEQEIVRELARHAARVSRADGVAVVFPDLDRDVLTTGICQIRGVEYPREPTRVGDGIIAEVARSGVPVRVGDREADRKRERDGLAPPLSLQDVVGKAQPMASALAVPLRSGIQLVGVLVVFAEEREVLSSEDEDVLATMASQAATAMANARRYAESERERRQSEALAAVARAVSESLRLGEVLRLILRHAVALLGAEGACLALRQDEYLHIVAAVGAADVLAGVHLPLSNSLLGHAVTTNERVVSNDFPLNRSASRLVQQLADIKRAVIAPLITGSGTIGALAVLNREEPFGDEDARVLQRLADHVAMAIVNARLFEEVERATREWKLAFDSIASGVVVLDESRTIQRCNSRAAELCGCDIASLLGQRLDTALLGEVVSREDGILAQLIARSLSTRQPVRDVLIDQHRARMFEILISPHPDQGCVLTFDDVTSVHRLSERHRRVLETVTDAIVITGLDGRISFANAAADELFAHHELIGQPVSALTTVESLSHVLVHEAKAREGVTQHYECVVLRSTGERRVVAVSSAPLVELGHVTGTVASLRDLTVQRAEGLALARSTARYEQLVESASDAIFTVDAQGAFTSVKRAMLSKSGYTREQLVGAPCTQLVDPADVVAVQRLVAQSFSGAKGELELRFRAADGAMRVGVVTAAPIVEADVIVGALGIMRDVTEQELRRASSAQQDQLASIGRLLGGVANELNNPLGSLLAVAELESQSMTDNAPHKAVIDQVLEDARRASHIVSQLLDATVGAVNERGTLDLNRVVRGAVDVHRYEFRERGISLDLATTKPLARVAADASDLQQLVANLLGNAAQVLEDWSGARTVRVQTSQDADWVRLDVHDSGPGIAAAMQSRTFEPVLTSRSARAGNGLGLAVSRGIAERLGGTLTVDSAHGAGTTFTLALPVAEPAQTTSGGHAAVPGVALGRLLLVEDEATLRAAISRYLTRAGYEVRAASGGEEALAALTAERFDLILLDLRMHDMAGDEVYHAIEAIDPEQASRILFITGDLHRHEAADFVRSTGRAVLAKPFELSDLGARIVQLLAPT